MQAFEQDGMYRENATGIYVRELTVVHRCDLMFLGYSPEQERL